jgi:hypothetical protein
MTDPRPLPPLPKPFGPTPRPLRMSGAGCGRGVWIGCGAGLLLFLVVSVALTFRADEMMGWLLGRLEESVSQKLPSDLLPAERERFTAAFEDLERSVASGSVDPVALQALQRTLLDVSGDVERGLTRAQVLELTEAVEKAAGVDGAPETPEADDGTMGPPAASSPPS